MRRLLFCGDFRQTFSNQTVPKLSDFWTRNPLESIRPKKRIWINFATGARDPFARFVQERLRMEESKGTGSEVASKSKYPIAALGAAAAVVAVAVVAVVVCVRRRLKSSPAQREAQLQAAAVLELAELRKRFHFSFFPPQGILAHSRYLLHRCACPQIPALRLATSFAYFKAEKSRLRRA